jgi:glutathione S-transferase
MTRIVVGALALSGRQQKTKTQETNSMITLYGSSISNYHNKVKMVLIEKGVPFVEQRVPTHPKTEAMLAMSPLGKVPYVQTEQGPLCESQVIAEYLEARFPEPPLLPADPYAAAKVRELVTFIELHLELVVRELYGKAFFGGDASESNAARVRKLLERNIAGFKQLARFTFASRARPSPGRLRARNLCWSAWRRDRLRRGLDGCGRIDLSLAPDRRTPAHSVVADRRPTLRPKSTSSRATKARGGRHRTAAPRRHGRQLRWQHRR